MTRIDYEIQGLRGEARCLRIEVRYARSGLARRSAREALAETLRNLRILTGGVL